MPKPSAKRWEYHFIGILCILGTLGVLMMIPLTIWWPERPPDWGFWLYVATYSGIVLIALPFGFFAWLYIRMVVSGDWRDSSGQSTSSLHSGMPESVAIDQPVGDDTNRLRKPYFRLLVFMALGCFLSKFLDALPRVIYGELSGPVAAVVWVGSILCIASIVGIIVTALSFIRFGRP